MSYRVRYSASSQYSADVAWLWSDEYDTEKQATARARALAKYGWQWIAILEYDDAGEPVREFQP